MEVLVIVYKKRGRGGCLTLTAAIHSARSWGGRLLHSRRTDGFEQGPELFAATDCASRVAAARASPANRGMNIPSDDSPMGVGWRWEGRRERERSTEGMDFSQSRLYTDRSVQ